MGERALNLRAMNHFLTNRVIRPAEAADVMDNMLREMSYLCSVTATGSTYVIPESDLSSFIYIIAELRNVFIKTAMDNGEAIEFSRVKEDYSEEELVGKGVRHE